MYSKKFEYTEEWYGDSYVESWLPKVNSTSDLKQLYDLDTKYYHRWNNLWFHNVVINEGKLLELGFNNGKTIYWLAQKYPELEIDTLDFSTALEKLVPYMKELIPQLNEVWFCDCCEIPCDDETYTIITCLDFYEHLPHDVYLRSIKECKRVLKDNGTMFVFLGKPGLPEHINAIPNSQVQVDMEHEGFRLLGTNEEMMIYKKESQND